MAERTIVFVDVETTRLDPTPGVITTWEIALVARQPGTTRGDLERLWQIRPDLTWADPVALDVGRYWERRELGDPLPVGAAVAVDPESGHIRRTTVADVAATIVELTDGAEMWGSNPAFDMGHLRVTLAAAGLRPRWHHHPNDLPSVARGWCAARGVVPTSARGDGRFRSDDWSRAVGIDPDHYPRHTAIGDARWARDQYDAMLDRGDPRV